MIMIYVIIGPTCSGKTSAAITLSEKLNAPIINGDAFQIYKDMDIGTSKISKNHPLYARHYLLDIVEPSQTFSVMEYQKRGRECLNSLLKDNKDVIIVGGTGLYIKALLYDYEFKEENSYDTSELEKLDNHELYELLKTLDEEESKKIHENNRKRLIRAIMLIRNNNQKKSEMIANQKHELIYPKDEVKFLYLSPDREKLYKDINERVIEMVNDGLVDEVKNLLEKYDLSLTARQGIGYKEIISYLEGEISLEDAISLIQKRTRNYAKRQVTFFKNQFKELNTFSSKEELLNYIKSV